MALDTPKLEESDLSTISERLAVVTFPSLYWG